MNDNEFKNIIKKEFDSVKAAPSAQERILRELKGAGDMEERTKDNINITNAAEIKSSRSWTTSLIAAAAAVAVGVGAFAVTSNMGAKRDDQPGAASQTAEDEGTPLGLEPAEGREGLYKVNDNTYFCPMTYNAAERTFASEDGMISGEVFREGVDFILDKAYPTPSYMTDYKVEWSNRMNGREIEAADYYLGYNVQAVIDGEDIRFVTDCGRGEDHTEQGGGHSGSFEHYGLVYVSAKSHPEKVTFRAVIKTTDGDTIYYGMYDKDVTADTEGYEDVSTLKLVEDEDAYHPDETPLGLTAAEGRQGLYELGEGNYFCPFVYYDNETYISEDGRVKAILRDGMEAERDYSPAEGNKIYDISYSVTMPEFTGGTFFAGFEVYATELMETYPLQISYSMGSEVTENGIEYRRTADDGDTITVLASVEAPEYFGYSSISPRVTLTTENGETIQYALVYNYIPKAPAVIETQEPEDTDDSPLGLSPAEGKEGLWVVNDETLLSPFAFDKNNGKFTSADGRLEAYAFEGISTEDYPDTFGEDFDPETMKAIGLRITNVSGDTLNGMYYAGANVFAIRKETSPLELTYMIWNGVEEQGVFAELQPGMDVTIALAVPKDIGLSEITPRALIGEDGMRIVYACLSEDYSSADELHHPAPDNWPATDDSQDEDSSQPDAEDSSQPEGVTAEDGGDVIKVNDSQVLVRLIKDGDTYTSVDGRFTAEYYVKEGTPFVIWTNNTGTEQKGNYFGGIGISPFLVDNSNGPEVWYHYFGMENGVETTLGAFESVTVEVPQSVTGDVTPRAVVKGSDGKDYIYIGFDELTYNEVE
ncbi:MAG: hypothetical protein IJ746_00475 [Ruminococcus sp.]|nr:hypothetical protein [Ruminococcus sp.]